MKLRLLSLDQASQMLYFESIGGVMSMTLTIDLPEELEAALKAQAQAQGVSAERYLLRVLQACLRTPTSESEKGKPVQPFETGRGMFSKYGQAPSAEEIDANRAEMFRGFAQSL
jgi:hypothetical protein